MKIILKYSTRRWLCQLLVLVNLCASSLGLAFAHTNMNADRVTNADSKMSNCHQVSDVSMIGGFFEGSQETSVLQHDCGQECECSESLCYSSYTAMVQNHTNVFSSERSDNTMKVPFVQRLYFDLLSPPPKV